MGRYSLAYAVTCVAIYLTAAVVPRFVKYLGYQSSLETYAMILILIIAFGFHAVIKVLEEVK